MTAAEAPYQWQTASVIIPFGRLLKRYFRVQCHGIERVPKEQPVIYVGKHPRGYLYFEIIVLGVLVHWDHGRRFFRVMEKANTSLHKLPLLGWMRRHTQSIDTSPNAALETLAAGLSLLIFPGGGRELYAAADNVNWPKGAGFARLAARAQVPVVPFAIVGADQQHPLRVPLGRRNSLWLPLMPLPVRLDYWFGDPIMPPPADADSTALRAYVQLVKDVTQGLLDAGKAAQRRASLWPL